MNDDIVTRLRLWQTVEGADSQITDELHLAADEIQRLQAEVVRWATWGEHVFTCPNKGLNPCRGCVSPATVDAMSRVDKGGTW